MTKSLARTPPKYARNSIKYAKSATEIAACSAVSWRQEIIGRGLSGITSEKIHTGAVMYAEFNYGSNTSLKYACPSLITMFLL